MTVAPMETDSIVPLVLPSTKKLVPSLSVPGTCYRDLDSLVLAHHFSSSLESHQGLGLEIVRRLQHRSDVAMKLQQRIASVEDELVKALEDKMQLLGELLNGDAFHAEAQSMREALRVPNDKVLASEMRVTELGYEVERCVEELRSQRGGIKSYKIDISMLEELVRDLKRLLEGKQAVLEEAQADALTACLEVARLFEENQRDSQEYVQLLGDVTFACLVVFLEESPCYDPTAEQWMTNATLALGAADHSLLARLGDSRDISVADIEALTVVIDPTTPGP
ncbi:hypothetical protein E3N88_24270 [Mikania micrantha]|uniref:Uncharacterized protein n=1 Tax=Mikania micrantha TaxID=192012 RepID=A0A5N6NGS3_9ASTR|nr:hypothetical protein E3N88_24270 [Mikania micrantha]